MLNHETVDDIKITVLAKDGFPGEDDTKDINLDVDDVNEAPDYVSANEPTLSSTPRQGETTKQTLWIKLYDVWEDEDSGDDDNDLTFTATVDSSWMKVLYAPAEVGRHRGRSRWHDGKRRRRRGLGRQLRKQSRAPPIKTTT